MVISSVTAYRKAGGDAMDREENRDRGLGLTAYAVIAALNVAALAGVMQFTGLPSPGEQRPGPAMRTENLPLATALDGLAGHGVLKVVNESSREIVLRLIGPEFRDSQTVVVPPWRDGRVFGIPPGVWKARLCTGSGWRTELGRFESDARCSELDDSMCFSEKFADEMLQRNAAVIRFGPSPQERPASHPILMEEFAEEQAH